MAFMKFIKSLALPSEMLPPIIEEESHFDLRDRTFCAKLGMWLFLATELLLFGGLLLLMQFLGPNILRCFSRPGKFRCCAGNYQYSHFNFLGSHSGYSSECNSRE